MMRLFIKIKDGHPLEHPIGEENFRAAFPDVDTNNLPPEFARFERVRIPEIGVYEIFEKTTYEWQNGVVRDVHNIRSMTAQEKLDKQNQIKERWTENGFSKWIFDEETCSFVPPFLYPDDGKLYKWNDDTGAWIEVEPKLG
jgi:hypothetical protein